MSDTRRVIVATLAAMAVFIGYRLIVATFFPLPPPPPPATAPAPGSATAPRLAEQPLQPATTTAPGPTATAAGVPPPAPATFSISAAPDTGPRTLGGREGDALRVELSPRGGGLRTLELFARDKKGQFVHRLDAESNEPYRLLSPVQDGGWEDLSYATHRVTVRETEQGEARSWNLDEQTWEVVSEQPDEVVFRTALRTGDRDVLRFTKTWRLTAGKPVLNVDLAVENASDRPLTIVLEQDGPIGITREGQQYEMRHLLATQWIDGTVELNRTENRDKLLSATKNGETVALLVPEKGPFAWTALTNRYFAAYTRPLPLQGTRQDYIASVQGLVAAPGAPDHPGDLLARMVTQPVTLAPGGVRKLPLEIYAGAKDASVIARVDPAYADTGGLHYQLTQAADRQCWCTFLWLQNLMVWLLEHIYLVVRNYGVAIIILVIIVRSLLHPLTVFQQKSMFRTQEAMARVQPRLNEIKERFANDRVRQNQEMMRLFAEEGVNPASNFVAFIPLFLQMPILVALWTALNTDVNLRHAHFDPWWITDLSAPDAFIEFARPISIPVLSAIPFLGGIFRNIASINLLPILMGVSMWLQQKYMPKPQVHARTTPSTSQAPARGMTPEQQLRQQQIMAYMMSILFPLMFYNMPSGLNLYWMATNVFGIVESLIIRRQLAEEKRRREAAGPRPPRRTGPLARFFRHIAAQAEEIQKKADQVSRDESRRRPDDRTRSDDRPRPDGRKKKP